MYAGPLHVYGGRADFRFRKDGSSGRGKRLLGFSGRLGKNIETTGMGALGNDR